MLMSEFREAICNIARPCEPIDHPYGPSVYKCYAFGRRYVLTIIDAELPTCVAVCTISHEKAKCLRFTSIHDFDTYFASHMRPKSV